MGVDQAATRPPRTPTPAPGDPPTVMSCISRGETSHHTGTVPLCSTTGATSSIDRTSTRHPLLDRVRLDRCASTWSGPSRSPRPGSPPSARSSGPTRSGWSCGRTRRFHLDVLSYDHQPLEFTVLNRHHRATQALVALNGKPTVVLVGPADVDFSDPAHLDTLRAFLCDGSAGVNLALGTWHAGPYPADRPRRPGQRAGGPGHGQRRRGGPPGPGPRRRGDDPALSAPQGPSAGAATVTPSRTSRTEDPRWPTRFR